MIGRGSKIDLELNVAAIEEDHVPVLQRASGGCAVVLTREMACVSFGIRAERQRQSKEYFERFLGLIIHAMETLEVSGLSHRGISDIALGERKVAGTALYRNRERIFFHAVINVAGTTDFMERYLAHPPRTPDYRGARRHKDFVTSLQAEGFALTEAHLRAAITAEFAHTLPEILL